MLLWRAATALVLAPIVLASIALGKWAMISVLLVVIAGAAYELSRALEPLPFVAALGAGALPLLLSIPYHQTGVLAGAVAGLPWALMWLSARPETRTLRAVLAVLLMSLWVGVPLAHLGLFPRSQYGVVLILIAVVGPWVSDSGAYFAGRLFGHNLLFPSLSPNKTVEGSAGGLLLTVVIVAPLALQFLDFTFAKALVIGAGVSVSSQCGDLFESSLKRILDVKDLGNFLPGHGGVLDRVDSLLFTAPTVYYISLLV
ncbi:MAG: phosphatidate cytidylyltransferase [Rubrobacter sp.]|nr:phosphatidate cytidylyltransferase [Rubrobacteraceae bacterium]MDQ3251753.1 phosphatidate cytidylyltransferase [Actinomycetota bacterium]